MTPLLSYFAEHVYAKLERPDEAEHTAIFERELAEGKLTAKEKALWEFVCSTYGKAEFSTKQLEKEYGAKIRKSSFLNASAIPLIIASGENEIVNSIALYFTKSTIDLISFSFIFIGVKNSVAESSSVVTYTSCLGFCVFMYFASKREFKSEPTINIFILNLFLNLLHLLNIHVLFGLAQVLY